MEYLLDTNICIYLIKKRPEQVIKKLERVNSNDNNKLFISSITVSELYYGAIKSNYSDKNLEALNGFFTPFQIINFDQTSAELYGKIRAELERRGALIGPYDMQIAAIAMANDLILVTNNTKEFLRIDGLKLENWV